MSNGCDADGECPEVLSRLADLDSAEWADKIFRTTVLNYLVASSSLYWGFGPDVYKSRAGSRCDRAALRFLGAVRNASGLTTGRQMRLRTTS